VNTYNKGSFSGNVKRAGTRKERDVLREAIQSLDAACQNVAGAAPGSRNGLLNRESFVIGQWVGAGVLTFGEAQTRLLEAAAHCGLARPEATATIRSGLRAGMRRPRDISTRNGRERRQTAAAKTSGGDTAPETPLDEADAEQRRARSAQLWEEAAPIAGTLAEHYLRGRGIELAEWPDTLRFHPRLWCREIRGPLPALICRVSERPGGSLLTIHRIFLAPDGSGKAKLAAPKKAFSGFRGGAIWLGAPSETLALAEGLENALVGLMAGESFAASAVSGANLPNVAPPEGVKRLLVMGAGAGGRLF
jgi:hypothetical protein